MCDVMKNDKYLKEQEPGLYHVAREHGTEPAFLGKYIHTTDPGVYVCAVCDTPLFLSQDKCVSECGWPCFVRPAFQDVVRHVDDLTQTRLHDEIRCSHCDAHLGHVVCQEIAGGGKVCDQYRVNSISLIFHKVD